MSNVPTSIIRVAALATLVSGVAFSGPLSAASADTPAPNQYAMDQPPASPAVDHRSEMMAKHVEQRIKTLHDKLHVTDMEEAKWGDVAQAMRDNETAINQLIQERHQNPATMTAVDDLESYEKIAQAHTDGLKKLIPAFQALYSDMPDAQKKKADGVFSSFEGHAPSRKHS